MMKRAETKTIVGLILADSFVPSVIVENRQVRLYTMGRSRSFACAVRDDVMSSNRLHVCPIRAGQCETKGLQTRNNLASSTSVTGHPVFPSATTFVHHVWCYKEEMIF